MKPVLIYVLKCPNTGEVRYVGKTVCLRRRINEHLRDAGKEKNHRSYWIASLLAAGLAPVVEVIDEVSSEHWPQWEVAWIEFFKEQGARLVNSSKGGLGGGYPHSEERKARGRVVMLGSLNPMFGKPSRWRGVPMTDERKAQMSAQRRGVKTGPRSSEFKAAQSLRFSGSNNPMFGKQAHNKGVPLTPEQKAKQSAAMTGRTLTEAHSAAISAGNKGKVRSEEARANYRAAQARRFAEVRARKAVVKANREREALQNARLGESPHAKCNVGA